MFNFMGNEGDFATRRMHNFIHESAKEEITLRSMKGKR